MQKKIKALAEKYFTELVVIRRDLHANPELSFEEFETSKYIKNILKDWKINFEENFCKTGFVAKIVGQKNKNNKKIYWRTELDALPITELNTSDYTSKKPGVMHACGHDVHMACLLGAIKIINELKTELSGTFCFVFQPAEEKLPGGAKQMLAENAIEVDAKNIMLAQHVSPDLNIGKVAFKKGTYMASADEIYLTIKGKGGHGALPHQAVDVILIASHIIVALQQIVSRMASPTIPTVLSIGRIEALGTTNVLPNEAKLMGTLRTFDENWRKTAHQKIKEICKSIAQSMDGECTVEIKYGYPCLINSDEVTEKCYQIAENYLGKDNVETLDFRTTADDFAYYSQVMPSCYFRLGVRNEEKNIVHQVHHPQFDVDESCLKIGSGIAAAILIELNH